MRVSSPTGFSCISTGTAASARAARATPAPQEDKDYLKLHEKLNFIEAKIAEMKVHVQRKRQEKQQLVEARRKREAEREGERRGEGKKLDLKQFVTQVPEHK